MAIKENDKPYSERWVTNGELADKLDKLPTRWEMRAYVLSAVLTILGVVFGFKPSIPTAAWEAVAGIF